MAKLAKRPEIFKSFLILVKVSALADGFLPAIVEHGHLDLEPLFGCELAPSTLPDDLHLGVLNTVEHHQLP